GWLRRQIVLPLAVLGAVFSLPWLRVLAECVRRHPRRAIGLALGAVSVRDTALYPPLAFDEILYHLPFAESFVCSGELSFLSDLRVPVFPGLGECIQAELWLCAGA